MAAKGRWTIRFAAVAMLQMATTAPCAAAEDELSGWAPFSFRLGVYTLDADVNWKVEKYGRRLEVVNLNRLGLDENDTSPWFAGTWRFGKKWSAFLGVFRFDEDGGGIWEKDFDAGDIVFPIRARAYSRLATDFYLVDAAYTLVRTPRHEMSLGFGIYGLDIKAELEAVINETEILGKRVDFLAPLPNVLAKYTWKVSDRWVWHSSLGWFGMSYEEYSGSLVSFTTAIEYRFNDRWGAGLGYSAVDMDVEIEGRKWTEIYDINFDGAYAFLSVRF